MPEKKESRIAVRQKESDLPRRHQMDLFGEMDHLFGDFRSAFHDLLRPERHWIWPAGVPRVELSEIRAPFCDLIDAGKEYKLCAEMPGIPKDKIDINVDEDSVEISTEAKMETEEEKKGYVSRERNYSSLYRKMTFPEEVIPEKAEASYKDGLLELRIPKKTPTEVKKHKVNVK